MAQSGVPTGHLDHILKLYSVARQNIRDESLKPKLNYRIDETSRTKIAEVVPCDTKLCSIDKSRFQIPALQIAFSIFLHTKKK